MMAATIARQATWVPVCRADQLRVDVGVAALVHRAQVALFRLDEEEILAIGNLDPYSRANVLSRGIVGSRGDAVFVASPMHKQPFDLRTGQCLDDPEMSVPTFGVRVVEGVVQVLATSAAEDSATADPTTADSNTEDSNAASSNAASSNAASSNTASSNTAGSHRGKPDG